MRILILRCTTTSYFRQRIGLGIWLLAAALLSITPPPAWASSKDSAALTEKGISVQDSPATIARQLPQPASHQTQKSLRTAETSPARMTFPIHVAGPISAVAARSLSNRNAGAIAVIYPDIGEPYRSVFAQIVDGIEAKAKGRVANFAVSPNVNVAELNNSLRERDTRVVIALGRQGMKVASALDDGIAVVVGGVLASPENETRDFQVHSLSPDPALLFSRLKGMMPRLRRIVTVYDPRQNAWMMRLAKEAARAQGLGFEAYQAQDLRSAMQAYQEILASADSQSDALWLPQDPTTVEDSSVLPLVLHESWARNLAVFSSSFGHVRRGVLFSLYPDNVGLGRHLAGAALGFLDSGERSISGILPLRDVQTAVNLRTAKHLGINTSREHGFDMVFPEQ